MNKIAKPSSTIATSLNAFDVETPLTFFVGWLSGKSYHLRKVAVHTDISSEFRKIAAQTIEELKNRASEKWTPEAEISSHSYLECDIHEIDGSPTLTNKPDSLFLPTLQSAEKLDEIQSRDIENKRLSIYGFVIGEPGKRFVFIRRANPRRGLSGGKIYSLFSDALHKVTDPVLAFDSLIDLVIVEDRLLVLSQTAFAMLFRDNDALKQLVPKWGKTIMTQTKINESTIELMVESALRDSRHRQRLESIATRGHLEKIDQDTLRIAMIDCGLDPLLHFNSADELIATESEIPRFLYFLNEDLFAGSISGENFRVDKKAAI